MRVGILYSGGKDSTFAAYIATVHGWDVCCLLTMQSSEESSYMFHTPNINIVPYQAEAMQIPLLCQETKGEKEEELNDLKKLLKKAKQTYQLDGIIVGALYSDYQQERVNRICYELNLKTFAPLWHVPQAYLLREMLDLGFEIIISAIAAEGLNKKWLGRKLDKQAYEELLHLHQKYQLHVAGEGGEYESLVLFCPLFKQRLIIKEAETILENECTGVYQIKNAGLSKH